MSVSSGQWGTVFVGATELIEIQNWKFNKKVAMHQWGANSSNGYKNAKGGTKSGTVSFEGKLDDADAIETHCEEGDACTVKLYINGTDFYTVPVVVESVDVECDIDDGAPSKIVVSAVTNGAWSRTFA